MSRKEFYQTKVWKQNSKAYALSKNCICERCGKPVYVSGITDYLPKEKRIKYIVHHKTYLSDTNFYNDNIALNWENLELLCIDCHCKEHFKGSPTKQGLMFDEEGNLIKKVTIKRNL